jgi:hypothetical protein
LARVIDIIKQRLPTGWQARTSGRRRKPDRLKITAPDGRSASLVLHQQDRLDPRALLLLLLQREQQDEPRPDVVVGSFLSPEVRRRLVEAGIGFVDSTGNMRLSLAEPGLFVETQGADRNPNPRQRPARSLAGVKAGRVVRALCKRIAPWGVREIAAATGTDPGYVSRLLAFLDKEAFVERGKRGRVERTDWRRLIPSWAEAAPLDKRGARFSCIAPRGLEPVMERLEKANLTYAVTGSFAAGRIAPVAPARLLTLYVQDSATACRALGLHITDSGANVMLIEPKDEQLWQQVETDEKGVRYAGLVQVVADLRTGPGRSPAEAEALLEWMVVNEEAWRG